MSEDKSIASKTDDHEHPFIKEVNITSDKLVISFFDGEEIQAKRQTKIHYEITDLKTKYSYFQHHFNKELMGKTEVFGNCKLYGDYWEQFSNILSLSVFLNQMDTESLIRENITLYGHDDREFFNISINEGEFFEMKIGSYFAELDLPRTQFQNFINKIEKNKVNKASAISYLKLDDAKFYKFEASYDSKSKLEKLCDGLVVRIGDHRYVKGIIEKYTFKINCEKNIISTSNDDKIKDLEISIEVNHKEQTNDEQLMKLFSQLRESLTNSINDLFKILIYGFVLFWLISILWPYASDYLRYFYELSLKN